MISEWRKFKGWKILEFFLKNPNTSIHIKGLARTLEISPSTSRYYLKLYKYYKLLKSEKMANIMTFSLNNEDFLTKELKKILILGILKEKKIIEKTLVETPDIANIILYGAYASGEFTENSDIDFLIITQEKSGKTRLQGLDPDLMEKVEVLKMSIGEWRQLVKKGDNFAKSVIKNHITLYGEDI